MPTQKIYHERQTRQLCALHALNNLFQAHQTYTKDQLDNICINLSPAAWINPHRSFLGLGNYDINVIMTALGQRNCEAIWFDKRKDPACINLDAIFGFILNVPSDYKFLTLPFQKQKHWIAVRRIHNDNKFYNLDSKLHAPECIGGENELLNYLRRQLDMSERELFVIVEKQQSNEQQQTPVWLKHDAKTKTDANGQTST